MKVDLHLDITRNVLFEKYDSNNFIKNYVLSSLDGCQIMAYPDLDALLFIKNGEVLFIQNTKEKKFVISEDLWDKFHFNFGYNFKRRININPMDVFRDFLGIEDYSIVVRILDQPTNESSLIIPEVLIFKNRMRINNYKTQLTQFTAQHYFSEIIPPQYISTRNDN